MRGALLTHVVKRVCKGGGRLPRGEGAWSHQHKLHGMRLFQGRFPQGPGGGRASGPALCLLSQQLSQQRLAFHFHAACTQQVGRLKGHPVCVGIPTQRMPGLTVRPPSPPPPVAPRSSSCQRTSTAKSSGGTRLPRSGAGQQQASQHRQPATHSTHYGGGSRSTAGQGQWRQCATGECLTGAGLTGV